jgi:hypothetical protein
MDIGEMDWRDDLEGKRCARPGTTGVADVVYVNIVT